MAKSKNNMMKNLQCMSTQKMFLYGILLLVLYNLFNCMFANKREYSKYSNKKTEYMDAGDRLSYINKQNTPEFVFYYANWCGHCTRAKPNWQSMPSIENNVSISAVDCDQHKEEATAMGVKSFPTFLYFPNGRLDPQSKVSYSGPRTLDGWKEFIKYQ